MSAAVNIKALPPTIFSKWRSLQMYLSIGRYTKVTATGEKVVVEITRTTHNMLLTLSNVNFSRTIFYRSYHQVKYFSHKKVLLYDQQIKNGLAFTAANTNRSYSSTSKDQRALSYIHEASSVNLKGITIGKLFQEQVEKIPDKEAFIFYTEKIRKTFSQFMEECDQLAAGFYCLGIQKGDRLGIWGPNTYEWLLTKFAAFRSGIILVNVNPAYMKSELEYVINKVDVKAIVIAEALPKQDFYGHIFQLAPELETAPPGGLNAKTTPSLKTVIMMGETRKPGTFLFNDVMQAGTTKARQYILDIQNKIQFDDPVNIQFTSGTTGSSKGATLSHHNIINNSYFAGLRLAYDKMETRICIPVPLYHCFGSVLGSLMMLTHGSTCVFPSKVFHPQKALEAVQDEKCTSLYGVPTMFIDMLNEVDSNKYDLTSLYTGVMAGSPCPVITMTDVVTKMHMPKVVVCYGSTETSPVTFQGHMDDSVVTRCTTIGQPSCHNEIKIVDTNGEIVPIGEPGELCTRGYTTMLGYWNDPVKTAEVISPDRWYRTGDMVILDEQGYGKIMGRYKDMIIRGGENIYPTEIEDLLYKHPKVRDIQIVGVPDARMGEEICACVQVQNGMECSEQELKDYCRQNLSKFKQPRYILFMDSYPLTPTGKIQKYKIQAMATKILKLNPNTFQHSIVGVPDARMGEEICACVQVQNGMECSEQELKDYCRQNLSKFKQPRYILFMDSYPLTPTGKIQKYKIQAMATKILKLNPNTFQHSIVGVPDARMGEEICACVQVQNGMECSEQELKDYCRQNLSKFKQPRYILFMDSYPLTPTGKIQKYKIQAMATKILKLNPNTFQHSVSI